MCLVAFQKIFRKIFSGAWKRRRKTQPRKTQFATLIAISPSRDRAVVRSRSWSRSRLREIRRIEIVINSMISRSVDRNRWWFFSWVCLFLLLFQTSENIFRKIFWNATKHIETFSFSGKRFTATKHSLKCLKYYCI